MFVATGAREQLLKRRRSEFADQYVRPLMTEAAQARHHRPRARGHDRRLGGPAMTAAADRVQDVTMRFREHTALDGVTTAFEQRQHHRPARPQRRRQDHPHAAADRPPRRRPAARVESSGSRPYENERCSRRICFVKEGQRYPDHFRVKRRARGGRDALPRLGRRLGAPRSSRDFDLPAKRPVKKLSRGMNSAVGHHHRPGLAAPS